jgi:aminoglycoside 6-adenylyltransferase
LSDYDIEMYVSDLNQFQQTDNWLGALGQIMVRWPLKPRTTFEQNWITRPILFEDGMRIDLQITDNAFSTLAYRHGFCLRTNRAGLTASS